MLIAQFLGTMRPDHDGVTRVMYRMRDEFASTSVRSIFISPILPEVAPADMRYVHSLPFPLSTDYRLAIANASTVKNILKNQKPDIIHIHTPCFLGRAAVRYALKNNIPLVVTYHTHFPTYLSYYKVNFLKPMIWGYLHKLYDFADAVIVPSKATKIELESKGFKNLVHIPHGVETSKFSPQYKNREWVRSIGAEGKTIVTFVGRLVWEKNLKAVVNAAKFVQLKNKIQFVIVGDGPARAQVEAQLPQAHFTGFLRDQELSKVYASSDVFFFPSVTETFGNVTVEAMASGLPAICANRGGACDIVQHEVNGFLTDGENHKGFAEYIDRLTEDVELRNKMAACAVQSSKSYQWSVTTQKYESLYKQILRQHEFAKTKFADSAVSKKSNEAAQLSRN